MKQVRLGVNIDHIATLRNARGEKFPCPIMAAKIAARSGADIITAHLREDRRHIKDEDVFRLKNEVNLPLNLEISPTKEMIEIAIKLKPKAVCLVPEKRQELTTEGGLDIVNNQEYLAKIIADLKSEGIYISMFVNPDLRQILAAKEIGANNIEIHTGRYCNAIGQEEKENELNLVKNAVEYANNLGLFIHGGHGLNFKTAREIAKIPNIIELNIGYFIISQSVIFGLGKVIKKMKKVINSLN